MECKYYSVEHQKFGLGKSTAKNINDRRVMLRIDTLLNLLNELIKYPIMRGLDIGCAKGYYSVAVKKKIAAEVIGADIICYSESWRLLIHKYSEGNALSFLQMDGQHLAFLNETFDLVVCIEVFEHFDALEQFLDEIHRVLKNPGYFFITTPNAFYIFEQHSIMIGNRIIEQSIPFLPLLPRFLRKRFRRVRDFTIKELRSILYNRGFHIQYIEIMPERFKNLIKIFPPLRYILSPTIVLLVKKTDN